MKTNDQIRGLLRLVARSPKINGWAKVSPLLWPMIVKDTPDELVEKQAEGNGGLVRLTEKGETVLKYT